MKGKVPFGAVSLVENFKWLAMNAKLFDFNLCELNFEVVLLKRALAQCCC